MSNRLRTTRFLPAITPLEDRTTPATHVYTNLGDTFDWSNPGNWSGGVPTSNESGGTTVEFRRAAASVMDIPGLVVDGIRFLAGGSTIQLDARLRIRTSVRDTSISNPTGNDTITTTVPASLEFTSTAAAFVDVGSGAKLTITAPVRGRRVR